VSDQLELIERKLSAAIVQVERDKNLRILAAYPEWRTFAASLEVDVVSKINQLCKATCGDKETITLRAEIYTLRRVLYAVKIPDAEFKRHCAELQDLRKKVDRLHTMGHTSDATGSAELAEKVDRLSREIEAMP
jgi:hypothetical protein